MKLAFFDTKPYDKPGFDEHIAGTDIEIKYFETRLGEDTVQLAKGFDGVCVFVNDTVNEKVINELYDLGVRVIALRCAGFNNVDTKACFGKLHVFRVPAYSPYAVAEHAMALLLTVNRHTNKAYIRTRDFNFSLSGLTGFDLHGKTVGVIGTGKIGRIFAEICKGFGMHVLAYDKFPNPTSGLDYVELPELLRQADVISLHCPLTDETRHMIDADAIAQMKPGVVLVSGGYRGTDRGAEKPQGRRGVSGCVRGRGRPLLRGLLGGDCRRRHAGAADLDAERHCHLASGIPHKGSAQQHRRDDRGQPPEIRAQRAVARYRGLLPLRAQGNLPQGARPEVLLR